MDYTQLTELISQVAQQRRDIAAATQQIDELHRAPVQCAKELEQLQKELDTLARKLAKLPPEQEGEYDQLQQELAALESSRKELSLLQLGLRHQNAVRSRACEKRSKEIRDYRSYTEASTQARAAAERLEQLQADALSTVRQLQAQVCDSRSSCTQRTLACLESITQLPEEDIRRLVTEAPQDWADAPMNLLHLLCQGEKAPLRRHLTPNQKVLLCARDHIPFPMGKYRWQVVRLRQDRALLICMDPVYPKMPFYDAKGEADWDTSDVCKRLNGDFLKTFSPEELSAILYSEEVDQRVFAFDRQEAQQYLSREQRAFALGWWLRDTLPLRKDLEEEHNSVYYIGLNGSEELMYCSWDSVYYPRLSSQYDFSLCCRPALWVSLTPEADDVQWETLWREAKDGVVSCKGKWRSEPSRWVRDYGYTDPHAINSGRMPAGSAARSGYTDYDPLHQIDYSDV